jgi:hypothetical protein
MNPSSLGTGLVPILNIDQALPYTLFALGVLSRIFVPWLVARKQDPTLSWSWRYIWPQLVTSVIVGLVLPLIIDLAAVANMSLPAAYIAGWGAADVGRTLDKVALPQTRG